MEAHHALRVFWITGLASVLVDLDHALAAVIKIYFNPTFVDSRFLHPVVFAVACLLAISGVACVARLYIEAVLKKR